METRQSIAQEHRLSQEPDTAREPTLLIVKNQQTKQETGKKSITSSDMRRASASKKRGTFDQGKRVAAICKAILIFLLSRVGLTVIVIGYVVLGGFLFQYLEGQGELLQRRLVSWKRSRTIAKLWNMTVDLNVMDQKNWTDLAGDILKEFQDDVYIAVKEGGWNGRDEMDTDVSWSFPGSLLFSTTVLTTIGYGHIAPKTTPGRVATMLYALPGIPLTLLWLSLLGSSWATCFIFFYKIFSSLYAKCSSKASGKQIKRTDSIIDNPDRVPLYVSFLIIVLYIASGSLLFTIWEEDWDFLTAMYFCFITLTTIGFGDYVFGIGKELNSNAKLITSSVYLVMGLAIIAMCFTLMQEEATVKLIILGRNLGFIKAKRKKTTVEESSSE